MQLKNPLLLYAIIVKKSSLFVRKERVTGIEPVFQPWEGRILPLNHTRMDLFCFNLSPINIPMVMKKQEDDSSLMG